MKPQMNCGWMIAGWLIGISFVLAVATVFGAESVKLQVSPHIGRSPQDIRITASIEPQVDNRFACVVITGPMESDSCWELRPDDRRTWEMWRKGFSAGRYLVVLQVTDRFGKTVQRQQPVCILGGLREGDVDCAGGESAEIP